MHKVELAEGVLLMQMAVSLQGSTAIRPRVNHSEAVKVSPLVRCDVGFQGFDDEPLVGICLAYISPEHVISFSVAVLRAYPIDQQNGSITGRRSLIGIGSKV